MKLIKETSVQVIYNDIYFLVYIEEYATIYKAYVYRANWACCLTDGWSYKKKDIKTNIDAAKECVKDVCVRYNW